MMINESSLYERQVDQWIFDAARSGVVRFAELLTSLPGIYPSDVLSSIRRLARYSLLPDILIEDAKTTKNASQRKIHGFGIAKHTPHPLDYDWRFTDSSSLMLLDYCRSLSNPGDTIALLGTPSLYEITSGSNYRRRFILLDRNVPASSMTVQSFYKCDLLKDRLPDIKAQIVVADPPWYPNYMQMFTWAAAQVLEVGGHMLLCLPPIGTRPGMITEINQIFEWTQKLGFSLMRYERGITSYDTPFFEVNALKAEGIRTFPQEWRHGDLALFSRQQVTRVPKPTVGLEDSWVEAKIRGVSIRVRPQSCTGFHDPTLIPIVPNDVLPSVSRRDQRRQEADVWTSGNRIFASKGRNILIEILNALSINLDPAYNVSTSLKRKLKSSELALVSTVVRQVEDLVDLERQEMIEFGYIQ